MTMGTNNALSDVKDNNIRLHIGTCAHRSLWMQSGYSFYFTFVKNTASYIAVAVLSQCYGQ